MYYFAIFAPCFTNLIMFMIQVTEVNYPEVRLELLRKRRFLMSTFYVGVPCACKRCMFSMFTCNKCPMNMFMAPFPDVYINYLNLL